MFGGDPFGGDPFGGDIFGHMRRQMRDVDRMMNSMMDPFGMLNRHSMFGGMPGMIDNGAPPAHNPMRDDMALMNPFSPFGGGIFGGMLRQMDDLHTMAENDPNSHVFSHSTMITFDGRNPGQPRIEESSMRKVGDVREKRHSVRHGDAGDRMSIEHSIGDRSHVIEKKRDREGRIHEQQRFVNLDEERAQDFDREFTSRARRNLGGGSAPVRQAIEGSAHPRTAINRDRSSRARADTSRTNAPIVTLPEDEYDSGEDHVVFRDGSSSRRAGGGGGGRSARAEGPLIREVTDEEEESGGTKRRKGRAFGKLFKANDE